jgi:formylglycine-generating enzyme required for sulfatase activity
MPPTACPPIESLARLLEGSLPGDQSSVLGDHVQGCSACQSVLDRLSGDGELEIWRTARRVSGLNIHSEEGLALALDRVVHSTTMDMSGGAVMHSVASRCVLGPPIQSGDLGSIGSYRVRSELGQGGMGVVFAAFDESLARDVALKVMRPDRLHERSRARFVREAQAVARVKHPNVVTVHSVANPSDGAPYLVMELVSGQSLRERIAREERLDPREAAQIVAAIADGLAAAHAAGLIHRDIKPSNIMLTPGGRPILTDFGLAQLDDSSSHLTQEGALTGTPCYMSPEQVRAPKSVDKRSDIYSLGVALYEVLTGVVPFEGTQAMVLRQVEHSEPRPPRQLNDSVPRDLETVCLKAMAKERSRRYASASEFAADLRRWHRGEPIHARPVGPLGRSWRWCRRNPGIALLGGVVVSLLVVIAAGSAIAAARIAAILKHLNQEREAGVVARVDALLDAAPDAVPFAIDFLRQSPETSRKMLRDRLASDSLDREQRAHAACALAELGDVRADLLAGAIPRVPASVGECGNIISALRRDAKSAAAVETCRAAAAEPSWADQARWATVQLHLGDARSAERLMALADDPSGRTTFVHGFASWHGELAEVATILRESTDPDLRSGLCLALGLIDPSTAPARQRHQVSLALQEASRSATESGTHSAAHWALTKWKAPATDAAESASTGADWFVSSEGLTMLKIPAGEFMMGEPDGSQGRTPHRVTITKPFFMSDREVSVQLFNEFLNDPGVPDGDKPDRSARQIPDPDVSLSPQHPVQNVSWVDAVRFCNWLSQRAGQKPCYRRTGQRESIPATASGAQTPLEWDVWEWDRDADGYRLPTEAEWEYACRARSTTLYYFGNDVELLPHYGTSSNNRLISARPCGSLMPNGWGLFDMHGNVWEWCWDWYSSFGSSSVSDPGGPAAPTPPFGAKRVYRGGGVANLSGDPGSSARGLGPPDTTFYRNLGFRVVCN